MKINTVDAFISEFRNGREIFSRRSINLVVREISQLRNENEKLRAELAQAEGKRRWIGLIQITSPGRGEMSDDMKLPEGETCNDCYHFTRCIALFGAKETNTTCDWSPSRFNKIMTENTKFTADFIFRQREFLRSHLYEMGMTVVSKKQYIDALDEIERVQADNATLSSKLASYFVRVKTKQKSIEDLKTALKNLYDACMLADQEGELSWRVNGELLDAARELIGGLNENRI
jgi:hypothetical protein